VVFEHMMYKVRADKAGAACYKYVFHSDILPYYLLFFARFNRY